MNVDKHISELLYEHDCVIVPKFGGFVSNYSSAKIHPTQHSFSPPSKKIVFNKNLVANDGLLANNIVTSENKSYPEAMSEIEHFVAETNTLLSKGNKVEIANVGSLRLDVERNIQFTPSNTNFHLGSFGLAEFQSPAIKREAVGKRITKEFIDREAIPSKNRKVIYKRIAIAAALLPLFFAMFWVSYKTDLLHNVNYADLNPFKSEVYVELPATESPEKITPARTEVTEKTVTEIPASGEELIETKEETNLEQEIETIESTAPSLLESFTNNTSNDVVADTTRVATTPVIQPTNGSYHLVAGCFQVESNAINFVADLNNQNISASIVGKRKGLFVVSCGDYSTRKEALENLRALKASRQDAWLLKEAF